MGVGLGAAQGLAVIGLGGSVDLGVLLPVTAVGKASLTELTLEWLLTRVSPRVDLEVLGAGEHLAAVGEGTGEGLLSGVDADVVYKFVFGFKRLASTQTLVPHAHMTQALETDRYVLARDVLHQLVHGAETLVANGCRRPPKPLSRTSSVNPFTNELGFDGGAF